MNPASNTPKLLSGSESHRVVSGLCREGVAEPLKIYISHSVGCAGWDMEGIYQHTLFQTGCRTSRFKTDDIGKVKMLDWDYLEWKKNKQKIEDLHLQLVQEHEFEVVMSMDLWEDNIHQCLSYTDKLQKYADRVLIPIHHYIPELQDYQLAYPNANWFNKNIFPPRPLITHILGGSPQSQLKHLTTTQQDLWGHSLRFPCIQSIDGNQLFNVAIRTGKEWFPTKPYWRKPTREKTNEEIFRASVQRFNNIITKI